MKESKKSLELELMLERRPRGTPGAEGEERCPGESAARENLSSMDFWDTFFMVYDM